MGTPRQQLLSLLADHTLFTTDTVSPFVSDTPKATDGWSRLLDEMETIASTIEEEGWETLTVPAGDAAAVTAAGGYTDRHGFTYVIPGDAAETFRDWFEPERFGRTEVYRATGGSHLFVLTVLRDQESERAVLIAGVIDRTELEAVERAARETDVMYSHLFGVDATHLGTIQHDDPAPFFPE